MQPPQLPLWILTHSGTFSAQQVYSLPCCISTCPLCSLFLLHVRHPIPKQMLSLDTRSRQMTSPTLPPRSFINPARPARPMPLVNADRCRQALDGESGVHKLRPLLAPPPHASGAPIGMAPTPNLCNRAPAALQSNHHGSEDVSAGDGAVPAPGGRGRKWGGACGRGGAAAALRQGHGITRSEHQLCLGHRAAQQLRTGARQRLPRPSALAAHRHGGQGAAEGSALREG